MTPPPFYVFEALKRHCQSNAPYACKNCPAKRSMLCVELLDYNVKRFFEIAYAKRRLRAGTDPTLTADPTRF